MTTQSGRTPSELCQAYLDALNQGDLAAVQRLFTEDAEVVSPLYGIVPAASFYAGLFADTDRSETTCLNVFDRSDNEEAVALHFRYRWTLSNGEVAAFECVDVFSLAEDRQRFSGLTILYDTAPLRKAFSAATSR